MHRALVFCLVVVSGCSTPKLDVGAQRVAIRSATSCLVGGVAYDKGQANPANPCEVCKPEQSSVTWTDADDGTRCDDGNACTHADQCHAGACVGGDPVVCKSKNDSKNAVKAACCLHGTAVIGASGGTVTTGDGTTVQIPLGALDSNTTITIAESDITPPTGAVSPIINFGPDGIVFAHPVTVTIPLTSTSGPLTTFWTKHDGSGQFEPIGGTVVGQNMVVAVTHFSSAYVAADPGTRSINGTEIVTWVAPNNIINKPSDLTTLPVEALVSDGHGGYTSYPGVGALDGTFAITGIPAGVAIIHAGQMYTQLDISRVTAVDLGSGRNGRPDQTPANAASSIVFDVGNMTPWQDADRMEFFCSNDTWLFDMQDLVLAGFPAAGDSSINNMTVPESDVIFELGTPGNLILKQDGTLPGDVCTLAHLETRQTADAIPVPYTAMAETFNPNPFDQIDGDVTTLTGSFTANATPNSVSIDIQAQLYAPLLAPVPAGANLSSGPSIDVGFAVLGAQGGLHSLRSGGNTADFMLMNLPNAVPTLATNIQYGQPLVGSWNTFAVAGVTPIYSFQEPNTNRFPGLIVAVLTTIDLENPGPTPLAIAPRLGPPQSPTINGIDWLQPQTGVGTTPTIAWSAPRLGAPDVYELDVYHLVDARPPKRLIASFATAATSLTLPASVLVAGEQYFFVLIAMNKKPTSGSSPPPITAAPFHFADVTDFANGFSAPIAP